MRYNLLGQADNWCPGKHAGKLNGLDFLAQPPLSTSLATHMQVGGGSLTPGG